MYKNLSSLYGQTVVLICGFISTELLLNHAILRKIVGPWYRGMLVVEQLAQPCLVFLYITECRHDANFQPAYFLIFNVRFYFSILQLNNKYSAT